MASRVRNIARQVRSRTRPDQGQAIAPPSAPPRGPESHWFWDHYRKAADETLEAFQSEAISLTGKVVADVGCGDGFTDLGLLHKARPSKLVGYDVNMTDTEYLLRRAGEEGIAVEDLGDLEFKRSMPAQIPAEDETFDYVFSWSAFEHVEQPIEVLTEIRRILSPRGAFFLQLWPFYFSSKGSHLWEWFPEDHHHLQRAECDVVKDLEASDAKPADWTNMMSREFQRLNRITVDELQRSMLAAGFIVRRVELLTGAARLTPELRRYSWLDLAVEGIKLIASPY